MSIKFISMAELIDAAVTTDSSISMITLKQTAADRDVSEGKILELMHLNLKVMKESVVKGLENGLKSYSGLSGGQACKMKSYAGSSLSGSFVSDVLWRALSVAEVNACMGRIVAAPTAGSCGILPACLLTLQEHFGLNDDDIVKGLLNASAVGLIIAKNASISGAESGCQAECGSAAAMAASAMVELRGGTPVQCGHAAALVLKSLMGLVCDPVAGLVEEPCVIRNASSAALAVSSSDLALAGIESIIPIDEVISAMGSVGRILPPSLRETAKGGLAATPTGKKIRSEVITQVSYKHEP
jgi:L-serine dehydratase